MIVVTNSGPLIALAKLGVLYPLPRLYGQVFVPGAVYHETVERGEEGGFSDALQIKLAIQRNQLIVMECKDPGPQVAGLPLHQGEKQAISCALENKADLVLLDDMLARTEAKKLGLCVKGTLGVIADAYRNVLLSIEEVRILCDNIMGRNDIWIADELCRRVLNCLTESR